MTAGSGPEITVAAFITVVATHHKVSLNDTCLMIKFAAIDPNMIVGLLTKVISMIGMDVLFQAV
ncbi:MAG: iron-containing alcohol dehydrogenase [Eggerthellaceae bacterium]|nr:iron-containing alcohol dehydrogenase [Eggerthellaceae bacterium]